MSTKITLYGVEISPPVRAVLLTLKALNLDYTYKEVHPANGDTKTPEYLKMNPQHTVPTLDDDGKYIWDSHAIITYLARKYGKDDKLYPEDFYQRAVVDQRLHYENGVIFVECMRQSVRPLMYGNMDAKKFEDLVKNVVEIYDMLETFLGNNSYMAGNDMTVADLSILSSVSSLVYVTPMEVGKHDKLADWLERMKKLPYYEAANVKGVEQINEMLKSKLALLK